MWIVLYIINNASYMYYHAYYYYYVFFVLIHLIHHTQGAYFIYVQGSRCILSCYPYVIIGIERIVFPTVFQIAFATTYTYVQMTERLRIPLLDYSIMYLGLHSIVR